MNATSTSFADHLEAAARALHEAAVSLHPGTATPAPATPPNAQQAPTCSHGARIHREGDSAKGHWSAWFCPQPKDATDKCAPIWE